MLQTVTDILDWKSYQHAQRIVLENKQENLTISPMYIVKLSELKSFTIASFCVSVKLRWKMIQSK